MRTIQIDKKKYDVPGTWNELSAEQLLFLAMLLKRDRTAQEVKLQMLLFSLEAHVERYQRAQGPGFKIKIKRDTFYLLPDVFAGLSEAFDYLFTESEEGRVQLDIRLTRNPFPVLTGNDVDLYGPEDGLTNLTFGQFVMLRTWQERLTHNMEANIDNFLAVMYKEGTFNGNDEENPKALKDVQIEIKIVLYWFYIGCMAFLREKFPRVFPGGSESGGDVFDGQMRLIDEMASGDVTKKALVKDSLLFDALYTLDMALERDAKMRKNG